VSPEVGRFPASSSASVQRSLAGDCTKGKKIPSRPLEQDLAKPNSLGRGPVFAGPVQQIADLRKESAMHFRPLHDRVVVRRIDADEKTAGGIIIPDTAKEKPQEGEVVAVGPGGRNEKGDLVPVELKAGDHILFGKWSGTEVKIDGEDLLIMKESDILGVVEQSGRLKKAA
jgi:chaperonin GroES